MKKLIVCGCSWMSVDTNNTSEYKGTHFSELLAEKLGYANTDTAKTKKYKCKQKLYQLVKSKYSKSDFLD